MPMSWSALREQWYRGPYGVSHPAWSARSPQPDTGSASTAGCIAHRSSAARARPTTTSLAPATPCRHHRSPAHTPPAPVRRDVGRRSSSAHRLGLSHPGAVGLLGEDWTSRATPASVHRTVTTDLDGGGTILLHDSDCTSAPGAWRSALGALHPRHLRATRLRGRPVVRPRM